MIIHPSGRFDNRAEPYEHIVVEELSAAMPCGEEISTRPLPRVRMIRQPPR